MKTSTYVKVEARSHSACPKSGEWAEIQSLPGYQAGDMGEIRNRHGRVLKQRPHWSGAMQLDIGKSTHMTHNLIARAFFGKPPAGYKLVHLNGDLADNRLENLAYRETAERCPNGHPLAGDNVVVIDNARGCLQCLLEVLEPGSERWIEYFNQRSSDL